MIIQPVDTVTFGYKSVLKKDFENGKIPLKKDITGQPLIKGKETIDHTIPLSRGGKSELYNYTLMNKVANNARGNKPLRYYIDIESLIEYIRVMLDVKTENINGVDYLKKWLKNLAKELKRK